MAAVRDAFRPEFLNRIDETLLFHRLHRGHMDGIVEIQLGALRRLLDDRNVTLELDRAARQWLAEAGYDPAYGARPPKRALGKKLLDPLALGLLAGRLSDGDTILARLIEGEISWEKLETAAITAA